MFGIVDGEIKQEKSWKLNKMKIMVTGGKTGFLGTNFCKFQRFYDLYPISSKDYNFVDPKQTEKAFEDINPDIVVHLAGKSGGILANKSYPVDFWQENMMLTANVWHYANKFKVKKVVHIIPGCGYPAALPVLKEENLFDGMPDIHPAPGALSKKMAILASYSYKQQYGLNSCVLIPANAYGIGDHFDPNNSHVIPSLILKMHKAKEEGTTVTLWGDGSSIRDFIYAEDVGYLISYFIENDIDFPCDNPCLRQVCNLSSGVGIPIKELAETIADVVGYTGGIEWDITKPKGPACKIFDNARMKSLGLSCHTSLRDGLVRTYEWYLQKIK